MISNSTQVVIVISSTIVFFYVFGGLLYVSSLFDNLSYSQDEKPSREQITTILRRGLLFPLDWWRNRQRV